MSCARPSSETCRAELAALMLLSDACIGFARCGAWRSLVAHLLWEQRVACSNHAAPTITSSVRGLLREAFSFGGTCGGNFTKAPRGLGTGEALAMGLGTDNRPPDTCGNGAGEVFVGYAWSGYNDQGINGGSLMRNVFYALALCCVVGSAQGFPAVALIQSCASHDIKTAGEVYCNGYFIGLAEGLAFATVAKEHGAPVCVDGKSPNQLRAAFEKFMREHPRGPNEEASDVMPLVMWHDFPCKK